MDAKIDPQLAFLLESAGADGETLENLAETGFFGIESVGARRRDGERTRGGASVQVLVQASAERGALAKAGLEVRSEAGDVFTGVIPLDRLPKLTAVEGVAVIESARELVLDLDLAIVDSRATLVHVGPPGRRGAGVIVGICDTGIDYTHPCFLNADGTSRILFIWDQTLAPQAGDTQPAGFGYGVEYNTVQINAAVALGAGGGNPFNQVRQRDTDAHGTHVAGIAAGNGRASSVGQPAFQFVGVAPEADIIVVKVGGGGAEGLGTSAQALDAVNYCFQQAASGGNRACVVNMSLGDNLGPHDGTSLLERGIDNLLGAARRAFVKSAGNVGNARHHAGGTVAHGTTVDVGFAQPNGNTTPDTLDFWYGGGNIFRAAVVDSAGDATAFVAVGAAANFNLPSGNMVRIDHRNNDPFNGDKRVFITITRGAAGQTLPGNWSLRLNSISSAAGGRFDGWIQRHNAFNQRPTFNAPFESNDRTISTPGTGHKVITAANYITRGPGISGLSASSSRGPTRDGRAAPTIAAPGTNVFSARSGFTTAGGDAYIDFSGTSMSAPHIAGIIALMFQKNPERTQEQIRTCLTSTARADAFTGPVPNTGWGAGKADALAAVGCVPSPFVVVRPTLVGPRCLRTVVEPRCLVVRTTVDPACVVLQTRVEPRCVVVQTTVGVLCGQRVTLVGCASLVDDCPSAPAGCDPRITVIDPVVIDPRVVRPVAPLQPGTLRLSDPQTRAVAALAAEMVAQWWAAAQVAPGTAGEAALGEEKGRPEVPPEGYYEYDEGWFEGDP